MIKSIKTLCLTCVFLWHAYSTKASSPYLVYADSLFDAGEYVKAAVEYEFSFYTSQDALERTIALLGKTECLKKNGQFADGVKCIERADYTSVNDSLAFILRYQSALCAYLAEDFGYAESQMIQLYTFISDSSITQKALPLYALILNELQRWPEAYQKIEVYLRSDVCHSPRTDSLALIFKKHYELKQLPKLKSSSKAVKLSSFLPGSGQLYLGFWGEGAINVSLQLLSVTYIGYNVWVKRNAPPKYILFLAVKVVMAV